MVKITFIKGGVKELCQFDPVNKRLVASWSYEGTINCNLICFWILYWVQRVLKKCVLFYLESCTVCSGFLNEAIINIYFLQVFSKL